MRIALSGTHRSGKSTLLEQLSEQLPDHATVEEPYWMLEEEGYEAADPPTIEDFQAQLEKSLECLEEGVRDVLFDRCPADILAYLETHPDAGSFDADDWRERVLASMQTLDLVIFVPIEAPDRIAVAAHEDRQQRLAVHDRLEALLVDDELGTDVEVLRVEGDLGRRVEQVLARAAPATAAQKNVARPKRTARAKKTNRATATASPVTTPGVRPRRQR